MAHQAGEQRFRRPARRAATVPSQRTLAVTGLSARHPSTVPGNSHVFGRIHR